MMKAEEKIRVVVVDDHPMVRQMLTHMIGQQADMTMCGEAGSIQEALQVIETTRPDIAVVDITLKGSSGLELIKNHGAIASQVAPLAVGFVVSFVTAIAAIKSFLEFIKKRDFTAFGWYRIILAIAFFLVFVR